MAMFGKLLVKYQIFVPKVYIIKVFYWKLHIQSLNSRYDYLKKNKSSVVNFISIRLT